MLRQTKFRRGFLIFRLPQTYGDSEMEKMQKLIDILEDNDDVQEIYHNWDAPEDEE